MNAPANPYGLPPGGGLTLSWPSATGRTYVVECCTNLIEGAWNELGSYPSTFPTNTVELTPSTPTCFFRMKVTQD